jgi:hypothetical protein
MRPSNAILFGLAVALLLYLQFVDDAGTSRSLSRWRAGGGGAGGGGDGHRGLSPSRGGGGGGGGVLGAAGAGGARPGCRIPPKALAIYQGKWWHTEVFGFILEFARQCGHTVAIYHSANHATSALPLWTALFPPLDVRPAGDFTREAGAYDAVFLTTPDDDLDERWRQANAARTVYAAHLTHPRFLQRWHELRLYMTPLAGWPYVLQVYRGAGPGPVAHDARAKEIVMIGTVFDGENYKVEDIFTYAAAVAAAGWKFVAFTRHWQSGAPTPDGVEILMSASTEDMYARVRSAAFVLVFPSAASWYHRDRITGALPLAVSAGTPLVTTDAMAGIYGLSAATGVLHGSTAEELAAATIGVSARSYKALVAAVAGYRDRMVANNVAVLELVLSAVPGVAASLAGGGGGGGGGGSGEGGVDELAWPIMPLSHNFSIRQVPDAGC